MEHILVLPRWYPNKTDIQLGIFIQRQIVLMQEDFQFTVIYVQMVTDAVEDYEHVQRNFSHNSVEHIIYFKGSVGPFRKFVNFYRFRKAQKMGMKDVHTPIDICHIQVPYRTAKPALELKRKKNIPFVITEHWSGHLNGTYQQKNVLDQFIYRKVLKKATKISVVSKALQSHFKQNTGFDSVLIPNLIEQNVLPTELEKRYSDRINILSVGDFIDRTKNQTSLIIALKTALTKYKNIRLTLIGGGPDEAEIRKLAADLDISGENLIFTGRQNHEFVLKAMNECDFYICNSRHETFGMTVAEALMAGKPVISTRCGGPEEFLNPQNSILINVTDNEGNLGQTQNTDYSPTQPLLNHYTLSNAIIQMAKNYKKYNSSEISSEIKLKFGAETVRLKWLDFYTI